MALSANEIRLGNWIKIRGEYEVQVIDNICKKWFSYMEGQACKWEDAEPIPLTEEILVANLGFKHKGGWIGKSFCVDIWDENVELIFEFMDNDLTVYAYDQRIRRIENPAVHQLQNLYFVLTGTELTFNP